MGFLVSVKTFVFIFCILFLINRLFNFIKVIRLKRGKVDTSFITTLAIGLSLSYIITVLIC